jgi:hypothetical protein
MYRKADRQTDRQRMNEREKEDIIAEFVFKSGKISRRRKRTRLEE